MGIYSHPWICHEYCSLCSICHLFQFNISSQYCFCHRCFVPSPNNAPLPFCSPVEEHLGGWGWTGASVHTDEVIYNLDYRHKHTNEKEPHWGIPDHGMAFSPADLELSQVKCLNYEPGLSRPYVFNEDSLTSEHLSFFSPVMNHLMEYWSICVNYVSFGLQPPTCRASVRSPK